jgi:hypothetical protein
VARRENFVLLRGEVHRARAQTLDQPAQASKALIGWGSQSDCLASVRILGQPCACQMCRRPRSPNRPSRARPTQHAAPPPRNPLPRRSPSAARARWRLARGARTSPPPDARAAAGAKARSLKDIETLETAEYRNAGGGSSGVAEPTEGGPG